MQLLMFDVEYGLFDFSCT